MGFAWKAVWKQVLSRYYDDRDEIIIEVWKERAK
jgi:hypothetical protein